MKILKSKRFEKRYCKLDKTVQNKVDKTLVLLVKNLRHPSLRTKKMKGVNQWEARVDIHYRLTFIFDDNSLTLLSVGMHDEGLGKK